MKKLIIILSTAALLTACSSNTDFPVSTTVGTLQFTHANKVITIKDHFSVKLDSLHKHYVIASEFGSMTVDIDSIGKVDAGDVTISVPDSILGIK